ncbi:pilus assembly protein PilG [Corallococcus exercitus]|uniref:Pilus assembly protein PilG n=1 Tax=Corallococcus exercitus TaxID=2316736 RepID=A0A7Y4JZ08_9BACT|nr:pilus assembly protein PilG [Corallococcus exercitus]NOK13798.1 pilus assembly protein PilG [Corallococcus exercitus]
MRKLPFILLAAGLLTLIGLSRPPPPPLRQNGQPLLPRPGLLRNLFRAQLGLVSDYFWIMTLNRIGSANTPEQYRDVYYYADLTTDLDPRLRQAYLYGGITIAVNRPDGTFANTAESTALLRKGVAALPDNPQLRFQLAYNLMFFEQKYKEAADIIQDLAKRPGAPSWYSALATRLYAQSGAFDSSLTLTEAMLASAEDDETRAFYERRIQEIHQEQILRGLDAALERFRAREGRFPDNVAALVGSGDLKALPEDPLGGSYFIGQDGRVYSTASKFRLEIIQDQRDADGNRVIPQPRVTDGP